MQQINRTALEQDEVHQAIQQIKKDYTATEDYEIEQKISENKYYKEYEHLDNLDIHRDQHIKYCTKKLTNLGKSIFGLDVGQPWCIYWPINALTILGVSIDEYHDQIIRFLNYCQNEGYGGGHIQYSHLAPTYSALLSKITYRKGLLIVGTKEAYESVDRKGLEKFFRSVADPNEKGSYLMHVNGESDLRGVYIVVIMVILFDLDYELIRHCPEYIAKCQTYEGGMGATPFGEAHGGYTFCGYAALVCMGRSDAINKTRLLHWLVQRQMEGEGGFNGRTNKVVDSCYSFWQGATFKLLKLSGIDVPMNIDALQDYVSICQQPNGGLFDKPGKKPDAYHTCYALSGYYLASSDLINPIYNVLEDRIQRFKTIQ